MNEEFRIMREDDDRLAQDAKWQRGDPGGFSQANQNAADFAAEVDADLARLPVRQPVDPMLEQSVNKAFAGQDAAAQDALDAARRIVDVPSPPDGPGNPPEIRGEQ